jgi:cobalamin biosynthesis protein CobT
LFDRKPPHEAYGLLASDNQTILPLGNDQIRFLETHNLKFRHLSMTKDNQTQSKTASDQIKKCEDEEILDANEDDEDVAEEVVEEEGVEEDEELNADEEEEEGEVEEVEEEDDGVGFKDAPSEGIGLRSIRLRSAYIRAQLKMESDGKGTLIILEVPYEDNRR